MVGFAFLQEVIRLTSGRRPQADVPLTLGEVSLLCNDGEGLAVAFTFMQGSDAA